MAIVIQSCNMEMYIVVSKFPGKTWGAAHAQTGAPWYGRTVWIFPHAEFASSKEPGLQSTIFGYSLH